MEPTADVDFRKVFDVHPYEERMNENETSVQDFFSKVREQNKSVCIRVHKYSDSDTIFLCLPLYINPTDLKWSNQDVMEA